MMTTFRILAGNKRAFWGAIILALFIVMALVGPIVLHLDMRANYTHRFEAPSFVHLMGTDYAGRDTFVQIVHGSRDVLLIAFSTALFGTLVAILFGFTAGLLGGLTDRIVLLAIDLFLTIPSFPIMAIFATLFRIHDPLSFGFVLSLWTWPALARSLRNQVVALRNKEFIEVCFIMDLPLYHVIFKELLPNMVPFICINFINIARGAITASVGIMMLGLVPLSVTNWGMMLNMAAYQTGAVYVPSAFAYILSPIACIVLFQFALICFAGGIEEIFDPRLR